MTKADGYRRVAIACQGGGSHTAFTAGALKTLLGQEGAERHGDYEVVALSGTSGGAICALLAWQGMLMKDPGRIVEALDAFWKDNSAGSLWERLLGDWLLQSSRLFASVGGPPVISPYLYPSWTQEILRDMLDRHVDFERIGELAGPSSLMLLVGAVDVLSGVFKAFDSRTDRIDVDVILASAALPTLFRAVHSGGGVYWDGLFSQNPPVRELTDARPDEIWVIQINPQERDAEPRSMAHIMDRRNELAGNLSLYQELYFIEKVNQWVAQGSLSGTSHRVIEVKWLPMLRELDAESKLDRDPAFIEELMAYGERQAAEFLSSEFRRPPGKGDWTTG